VTTAAAVRGGRIVVPLAALIVRGAGDALGRELRLGTRTVGCGAGRRAGAVRTDEGGLDLGDAVRFGAARRSKLGRLGLP
jgi:hypothetical protein